MNEANIAAIILTRNEERDVPACLESLRGSASRVYVVDSGSTDRTVEIAAQYGAHVLVHEFFNHASQFNWALDNMPIDTKWVLRIDADERLSPELRLWLVNTLASLPPQANGVLLPLRIRFLGRAIRWGDSYPVWLLRLFRHGHGRCEETWMDEHIVVRDGTITRARGDLIHEIPKSLSEWSRKHVWYAERECRDILASGANAAPLTGQPRVRRALKQEIYLRLPLFVRPFLYWFYRYFLRLGFLDGEEGLIYHFLHAFWYRFLVDAKLYELRKAAVAAEGAARARHL